MFFVTIEEELGCIETAKDADATTSEDWVEHVCPLISTVVGEEAPLLHDTSTLRSNENSSFWFHAVVVIITGFVMPEALLEVTTELGVRDENVTPSELGNVIAIGVPDGKEVAALYVIE